MQYTNWLCDKRLRFIFITTSLLLAGCVATPLDPAITGYSCCNLHSNRGWIAVDNSQGGDLIPAGEAVKLTSSKRQYYVYGTIGDYDIGFRDDYAKSEKDTLQWIHRIVVSTNPQSEISSWPSEIRAAVGAARVTKGMTRAQVATALGYPSPNDTPDLNANTWRYWMPVENLPVDIRFDNNGKVTGLLGEPSAVHMLELQR
ncbi:MAG: outer membrane protein assembly factor BamE domain-containing protein [Sulfuricaulis sp.]